MNDQDPARDDDRAAKVTQAIRFDLVIAVCALLISSLATGASWWQGRILQAQTQVLQSQLGAQVWPYISVGEVISNNKVSITVTNDGLGPALLRSLSATVDGVPKSNFSAIAHAVLGPHLLARSPRGEKMGVAIAGISTTSVLRPGESTEAFALNSKSYALPFLRAYKRLNFRTCYCAIIPGKCWLSSSSSTGDPQLVQACPEDRKDLLHASAIDELMDRNF